MISETKPDQALLKELRNQAESLHAHEPAYQRAAWLDTLLMLIVAVLVALSINQFVFQIIRVEGPSMQPTFWTGERVFTEKISYTFREPRRKEVVVARYFPDSDQVIKRVIGLPGDTIEIRNGVIYINDDILDESAYWHDIISYYNEMPPVVIPEKHVFLIGDNRNNSYDSREVGPVPYNQIVGHVAFRIWPLNRIGRFPQ